MKKAKKDKDGSYWPPKLRPDHEAASNFAETVIFDENQDISNLARAYFESVLALRDSDAALEQISKRLNEIGRGVVSVGAFLGHADKFLGQRKKGRKKK